MYPDLPAWTYLVYALGVTHLTIISVTVFLHRCQTHRALDLHPLTSHLFRFWLWLTTGMVTREWVAVHRRHHAAVESEQDPHSPVVYGIRRVLLDGTGLYRRAAADPETLRKYGHGTPDDWLERRLYTPHPGLGIALLLVLNFLLFGFIGITIWAVQMIWIPVFAAGVINGVGHWRGYRNFETPDASTNIIPLGLLIGGEELHNNHHAFASSARFSSRWYELDLGWWYVRGLAGLGLARIKKCMPRLVIDHTKQGVDLDTVRALVGGRLHVMSRFARDVVRRVYREEKRRATEQKRDLLRMCRRFLYRHEDLLDTGARQRLEELFLHSEALKTVCAYRRRLQTLWQQKTLSQERLLAALQEWCQEAEATGIEALEEFARKLRGYSLQPAV